MQSTFPPGASPLNERLTLVLLVHEQPRALRRALRYYSSWACAVQVIDSSAARDDALVAEFAQVRYQHLPTLRGEHFSGKLRQAIATLDTPYTVLADVGGFLLDEGVEQSLAFLDAHPDYGVCQGYSLAFEARAQRVDYQRRDRKGVEDYCAESAEARLEAFASHCPSLVNGVVRTELLRRWYASLPADLNPSLQEIGHSYGLMAAAKVRLLPIPYGVQEWHCVSLLASPQIAVQLSYRDAQTLAEQDRFAQALTAAFGAVGSERTRDHLLAIGKHFAGLPGLEAEKLFESSWDALREAPVRRFEPTQYVELPFYNQAFFERLSALEFLLHALPSGRRQLEELEGVLLKQKELLRVQRNASAEPLDERLERAFELYAFDLQVVRQMARSLLARGEQQRAQALQAWEERVQAATLEECAGWFATTRSGRLLQWLEARDPDAAQAEEIARHLARHSGGPSFGILLLDLQADILKLQATFDSVINSYCRNFKIIVFTSGELPSVTTLQNTLHFVKVDENNYIDKINQVVRQSDCDWMVMAEAGDELTASGLHQASLELLAAPQCRAVAMDEIQRLPDGTLRDVFRPGFNLDLLQNCPTLLARHWLVRRDVLAQAGGYSREFKDALEFDLLLRLIEQGGLDGLAHLAEPLLICQAPMAQNNADERKTLLRHLATRGYQAEVSAPVPGTHKIDYRFSERPMVSIILHSVTDLPALQRCLLSVMQRTRYQRYEILLAEDAAYSAPLNQWLATQGQQANRLRQFGVVPGLSAATLINTLSQQAKGEYLVTLAADGEVLNVNWIESLLNQVQRPEVGVVGAKLVDHDARVTQAGLILGFDGCVGSAFVAEPKTSVGYLNRLVVEQDCSAVSFACLMIAKQLFDAADGIDDGLFAEGLGDVDLCLRLGQAGYLTVWTPHVLVIQPGVLAQSPAARQALAEKWPQALRQDPFYNRNLTLQGRGYGLGPVAGVAWAELLKQPGA
ncbi:TIGR00180 family glycosyltransferase [Pseudomonas chlororaphis]|nr:TIGR00180 family glycosyltransferase [Pseudomonas chlororaphis]